MGIFPCNIRKEGGYSLVMLEVNEALPSFPPLAALGDVLLQLVLCVILYAWRVIALRYLEYGVKRGRHRYASPAAVGWVPFFGGVQTDI